METHYLYLSKKMNKNAHQRSKITLLRLNHHLHGLWTPGYHTVNIALHAINTLLVHRLTTVISSKIASGPNASGYGSWAAAAAFAVHPVHVEAVRLLIFRLP